MLYLYDLIHINDRNIDHGLVHGWNGTTYDVPITSNVHPENFTVKGWGLLHHAGFLTYPHHDAEGSLTWVRMEFGIKFWVIFRPNGRHNDRRHMHDIAIRLGNFTENEDWIRAHCRAELITLFPGDTLCVVSTLSRHAVIYFAESCHPVNCMPCTPQSHLLRWGGISTIIIVCTSPNYRDISMLLWVTV